jgi:hypothetical protein
MIAVKLQGGLGNQMFQYATARRLALHNNTKLYMDLSGYNNQTEIDTPREYELDCFNVDKSLISIEDYVLVDWGLGRRSKTKQYLTNIHRRKLWCYSNPEQGFHKEVLDLPNNTYLVGWFQSEKYFADIRDILLQDFAYTHGSDKESRMLSDKISSTDSVSIHVRRGDYVTNSHANKFHGLASMDFYLAATKYIESHIKKPNYFVFSDDPEWCKENLKLNAPTTYVSHNTSGAEDMRLMRECKHNIIANSSFSWWAAWLNRNPDKVVVAPKFWFANSHTNGSTDIIPTTWHTV